MDPDPSESIPIKRPAAPPPVPPIRSSTGSKRPAGATTDKPAGGRAKPFNVVQGKPSTPPSVSPKPPAKAIPIPPPPSPTPAVQVDANKVVIRTMRDDITAVRQGANGPSRVTPVPATTAKPAGVAPQFPLPPRSGAAAAKTVTAPAPARPRRKGLRAALITLFAVLLLVGGGAAAWFFWLDTILPGRSTSDGVVLSAPALIPANYLAIIRYQVSSAADRTAVTNAWQAARGTEVTTQTLLAGDPRLLLADPELPELYYVLLEDAAAPFLLVPKTAQATQYLVDSGDARFIEKNGWYIAHAVSVAGYQAALAEQTLAAAGGAPAVLTDVSLGVPLRVSVGAGLLPALRTALAGEAYLAGQLQEVTVAAQHDPSAATLRLSGTAARFNPLPPDQTNQELLSLVPAAVTATRLGANFKEDVRSWVSVSGGLDAAILARPAVSQLIDQLATPYAWFLYPTTRGSSAVGLIIELPATLQGIVGLGDAALEQALPALVPLMLDRPTIAPVSFTEVTHGTTPLRFANISGTDLALDYALTDRHILVATSKESMFALIDTVTGTVPSLAAGEPWQTLLAHWGALPPANDIIFGSIGVPGLLQLLPTVADAAVPLGVAFTAGGGESTAAGVSGVIDLRLVPVSQLAPSPAP